MLEEHFKFTKTSRNRRQAIFQLQDFLLRGYHHFLSVLVNCFCFKSCWANHFTVCLSMDAIKHFKHQQVNTSFNFYSNTSSIFSLVESRLKVCLILNWQKKKNADITTQMISDKNFLLCVNDQITCYRQSAKALVKAKQMLTISDKNFNRILH